MGRYSRPAWTHLQKGSAVSGYTLDDTDQRSDLKTKRLPICRLCTHWEKGTKTCRAFPKEIPNVIFLRGIDHRQPFPGDRGIRFEPIGTEDKGRT